MSKIQVWKPKQEFAGKDLMPELVPQGESLPAPPGGLVGRENVDVEDLVLPSLTLLQGMSEPVTSGMDGAKPGHFWIETSGEIFEPPLRLLIVHHSRSRALFPQEDNPRTAGLKKCLARDALEGTEYGLCEDCNHRKWSEGGSPPPCSESHNFVAWTVAGPAVLRYSKTSFKAARNFLTTWTMSQKNLWAHPAIVTVKSDSKTLKSGKKTTYYMMDLRWDTRDTVPPEFQENALKLYQQISQAHEAGRFRTEEGDGKPSTKSPGHDRMQSRDDIPF